MTTPRFGFKPSSSDWLITAPRHTFGFSPPPDRVDRSDVPVLPLMGENNVYPDCTTTALISGAVAVAALNGFDLAVDPAAPLKAYAEALGNPPDLAATDGAMPSDILAYQDQRGLLINPTGQPGADRLTGQHGIVGPSQSSMAKCIDRLGGMWFGATLTQRDLDTGENIWDTGDGKPDGAVVGRHMMWAWDYLSLAEDGTVRVSTLGHWQRVTWHWLLARSQECYGLVWRQLERSDGTFYSGLTADGLVREAEELG